jgi:hypothetical protein
MGAGANVKTTWEVNIKGEKCKKSFKLFLTRYFSLLIYYLFSVRTPTPVHPLLKVRKPWQIWFIFSLQDVLERKKYKNGKKNLMKLVRWVLKVTHVFWSKIDHFLTNSLFIWKNTFFWFLDPKIVTKSVIRFVLRWNLLNKTFISPFWVGICMGGTLRTQNFKILSTPLSC